MAGLLSTGGLELRANPLGLPIGCHSYPIMNMIARDFPGTIKQLAAVGFQSIELCSPVGYADSDFASLAKYSGGGLQKILNDQGVTCESSHLDVRNDAAEIARNILAHERFFRLGTAGDLIYCVGVVVLLTVLCVILEPVNRGLALLAALWRLGWVLMWLVMTLCGSSVARAFKTERLQALARLNLGVGFD